MFNLLIEEDYFDPCAYGNHGDEELDFHVNGDIDKKDLDLHELENVKVDGCQHNIHSEIWAINVFNAWQKYKKLDISLSIMELHASKPKLLVNYLSNSCCK